MALILPKGIVVNSPGASDDILRSASRPLEDEQVRKFWQVYTTTKRRLVDPTAERLENLFWRIWGSRNFRQPSSIVTAQLFTDISTGNTYPGLGPLKSPAPRDESGVPSKAHVSRVESDLNTGRPQNRLKDSNSSLRPPKSSLGSKNPHVKKGHTQNINGYNSGGTPAAPHSAGSLVRRTTPDSTQSTAPSSFKASVSMPPPILKKARGQSSSGPKPTARFISPGISEDEKDESAVENENDSPNAHVVVRPPTPPSAEERATNRENAPPAKRKPRAPVVATVGGRKRPVMRHRPSSQSSTGSEASVHRDQPEENEGVTSMHETRRLSTSSQPSMPRVQEQESGTEKRESVKSGGKVRPGKPKLGKQATSKALGDRARENRPSDGIDNEAGEETQTTEPETSRSLRRIENKQATRPNKKENDRGETEERRLQEQLLAEAKAALEARKAIEDEELDKQSRKFSSNSRRAMSAHNLSAAYRTIGRSGSDSATTAQPTTGLARVPVSTDGIASINDTEDRKGKRVESDSKPLQVPKKTMTSQSSAVAALPPTRSMSNLSNLLKKDDEKKAKERKGSSGHK